jgi:hypothetical protein
MTESGHLRECVDEPATPEPFLRVVPAAADHSTDCALVVSWLCNYVSRPHHDLGRSGPICPFVLPAFRADTLQFSFRYDVDGSNTVVLRRALIAEMLEFKASTNPKKEVGPRDGRLVIMPRTGPDGWRRLDKMYTALKNLAVRRGLMIGQFHPDCDERAVRNPQFPVSVSPVCLLAIRHVAPHDVLFLSSRPDWFVRYHELFRGPYARGRVRDPLMQELYREAVEQYAPALEAFARNAGGITPLPASRTYRTEP